MSKPTVALTRDQIDFYKEQGYLTLDAVTTPEELVFLRDCYDKMFREQAGREAGEQFDLGGTDEEGKEAVLPQILGFQRFIPDFAKTLLSINCNAITKALLGADASSAGGHAIFKPAKIGAETPWHQDEAYWATGFEHRSLSIWIPLQEATLENGCMHFVPGSHKLNVLTHQSINNDPRIHGLELVESEMHHVKNAVACPLPPGGATIHHQRTMHYTPPNRSDIPRRAMIMMGSAPGRKLAEPGQFPWQAEKQTARTVRAKRAAETAAGAATKEDRGHN